MSGVLGTGTFGIGTTRDSFHFSGTLPNLRDRLKREVTEGAMLAAVAFSILADTSSGPLDFDTSKEASISYIDLVFAAK